MSAMRAWMSLPAGLSAAFWRTPALPHGRPYSIPSTTPAWPALRDVGWLGSNPDHEEATVDRQHRVMGALVGSAVGDALGAPFEFGPPDAYSARFPTAARGAHTEMCGGGSLGWEPGEFTDDTQMALLLAESLVAHRELDGADVFDGFRTWAQAGPPDIGVQTSAVLLSGLPWDAAASEHVRAGHRAAGNGSLMRATPPRCSSRARGET